MTVYFSHATSFCGGVWDPVRSRLSDIETVAFDHPGHGAGPPLEPPIHWSVFGDRVLEVAESGGVGVGHSMGAAAIAMAQIADPNRFRALVLVEPVVFPGPIHGDARNVMSDVALRRTVEFESREAAIDNFRRKEAFAGWDEDALWGYARCGLVGDGPVRLACRPEVEADIYRGSRDHDTWDHLGEIEIPVLLMSGETSDTIPPRLAHEQASLFQKAGVEVVPDAGHFLPVERPGLVADRIRRIVETVL